MRKLFLSLAASFAILAAGASVPASAVPAGMAATIRAAAADVSAVDQVVYICRQRYWSGRRYCYWRPGGYNWRWRWHRRRWW